MNILNLIFKKAPLEAFILTNSFSPSKLKCLPLFIIFIANPWRGDLSGVPSYNQLVFVLPWEMRYNNIFKILYRTNRINSMIISSTSWYISYPPLRRWKSFLYYLKGLSLFLPGTLLKNKLSSFILVYTYLI